jgi:choloylglycine hydrolase
MDLYIDEKPTLLITPIGTQKTGGIGKKPLEWTSKYGSVLITAFKVASSDGVNDQGLAAHLLYLHSSEYEKRDRRPALPNSKWVEYVLDNYKNVKEAIKGLTKLQIVPVMVADLDWPLHLCIEDKNGDSAIFEFIKGKLVIHHNRDATVMTNDPFYMVQVTNLKNYAYFGGKLPLPGDMDSMSRFVRLSAFLKTLPTPASQKEALEFTLGVIRSAEVPFGALDTTGKTNIDTWPTRWVTATNLTTLVYYFQSTQSLNTAWIDLNKINFKTLSGPLEINLQNPLVKGDISNLLFPSPN